MVARLLPPNASPLEFDLEQAMAVHGEGEARDVAIGSLWDPCRCPEALLPWIAWGLGVKRWDPDWPEATRREVVKNAIAFHRERGTLKAVKRVLDDIGAVYDIEENPAGVRHTMAISVRNSNALLGTTDTATIRDYIDDAKRFSVHFTLAVSSSLDETDIVVAIGATGVQVADFALTIDGGSA